MTPLSSLSFAASSTACWPAASPARRTRWPPGRSNTAGRKSRLPPSTSSPTDDPNPPRGGDFRQNQDLADLMGFYQAFGLNLRDAEESRERPDHIAVELEFLHFLCWKEAAARVDGDEEHISVCLDAERKFLGDHLGRWADLFARGLEKTAPEGFYPALAALLRAVVAQEVANLDVKPEPVAVPEPSSAPEPMTCGADETPAPLVQIGGTVK